MNEIDGESAWRWMPHKMNLKQVFVVPDNGVVIVQLYFYVGRAWSRQVANTELHDNSLAEGLEQLIDSARKALLIHERRQRLLCAIMDVPREIWLFFRWKLLTDSDLEFFRNLIEAPSAQSS